VLFSHWLVPDRVVTIPELYIILTYLLRSSTIKPREHTTFQCHSKLIANSFYRRGELARRLAIFYAAQSIASAFGGLLAFGVFQIKGGALDDWRYLFLIEGLATVCFSCFAFWYLPYSAAKCSFLNEEEKALAFLRMQVDSSSVVDEKFNLRDAIKIFKHPTSWIILGTFPKFLPLSHPSTSSFPPPHTRKPLLTAQASKSASVSPSNLSLSSSP
jgi:MFS family permease